MSGLRRGDICDERKNAFANRDAGSPFAFRETTLFFTFYSELFFTVKVFSKKIVARFSRKTRKDHRQKNNSANRYIELVVSERSNATQNLVEVSLTSVLPKYIALAETNLIP